jgi:hypothetical protein
VNKLAVLAASLVASFALAFAVYSAESNTNNPRPPQVVASVRLTNQTQPLPTTTIFNVRETGLYRISSYIAMTTPGAFDYGWSLCLGWTDEAGLEQAPEYSVVYARQSAPFSYGSPFITGNGLTVAQPVFPIEAIAGTPISYAVTPFLQGDGTYELFMTVERLQ